jgi:hypothetical protein
MADTVTEEALVCQPLTLSLCDMQSKIHQSEGWKKLSKDNSFFAGLKKEPIDYIKAVDYERKLYCFDCQNIEFQTEDGDRIWDTRGSGEMECLPRHVGVYIVWGTSRTVP